MSSSLQHREDSLLVLHLLLCTCTAEELDTCSMCNEQQHWLHLQLKRIAHPTAAVHRDNTAQVAYDHALAHDHALALGITALKADLEQGTSRVGDVQGNMCAYPPAPPPTGLDD